MFKNKFKHVDKNVNDEFQEVQARLTSVNSKVAQLDQIKVVTKHPSLSDMKEGVVYASDDRLSIKVNGVEKIITFT